MYSPRFLPLLGAFAAALTFAPALAGAKSGTLDIYWVDSMGGGSTLIVTPTDESILIDAGNPGGRDAGRIHKVATEVAGVTQIDHHITTHLHIDHFGGAAELSQLMPIRHLYNNGIPDTDPDGNPDNSWPLKIKAYREMKVEERHVLKPDDVVPLRQLPGEQALKLELRCVAAKQQFSSRQARSTNPDCSGATTKPKDPSDNANSIVNVLSFGRFLFFDGGDLTWNTEAGLACPSKRVPLVDVYQVNHHGLDVSNNPLLLRALQPTVAVFNNGPRKGCMPEVVKNLHALPTPPVIFQVHKNQQSSEANAPADFCANTTEEGGNFIKLAVAPDAKSYTVSIPATGFSRTFNTRQ